MKLKKKESLLLAAGVIALVIAALGFIYWRQLEQQRELSRRLAPPQGTPAQLEIVNLVSKKIDLQAELSEAESQLETMQTVASPQIVNSTITRALFDLAKKHGLEITEMVSSVPTRKNLDGADFSVISLTIRAEGDDARVVDFVIDLNGRFSTGVIETVDITVRQDPTLGKTQVYALMNIYTN